MAISSITLHVFASPRPLYRISLPDKLGCYSPGPEETLAPPKEGKGLDVAYALPHSLDFAMQPCSLIHGLDFSWPYES